MSFEPLPKNLEKDVQRFAEQEHTSHDEAVLKLIETGLRLTPETAPTETGKNPAQELIGLFANDETATEALDLAVSARRRNLKKGPQQPLRTNNPEKIIGLFVDVPELAESVLHVVETRSERYMGNA